MLGVCEVGKYTKCIRTSVPPPKTLVGVLGVGRYGGVVEINAYLSIGLDTSFYIVQIRSTANKPGWRCWGVEGIDIV